MSGSRRSPVPRPPGTLLLLVALGMAAQCLSVPTLAQAPGIAADARKSGYAYMGRDTRAMQDDELANPGMLAVLEGEALWSRKPSDSAQSCAGCHGDARTSMRGVAARHPAFDARLSRPVNLEQRINECRVRHQQSPALPWENRELLALSTFVAHQSRGLPIAPPPDARLQAHVEAGRATYHRRQGQLNLACVQCHDGLADRRLVGNPITQGQATGYPIYRLEWQSVGSLQRRLRNCMTGVRAEPFAYGSEEMVNLEAFLMQRARGMPMETPAVRP